MPVTSNCRGNQGNIIQNTELRMPWSPNTIDIMHVKSFIVCLTLVKNHPQYHHTWVVKTIPKLDRFSIWFTLSCIHGSCSFLFLPSSSMFPLFSISFPFFTPVLRRMAIHVPFFSFPFMFFSLFSNWENTCFHFKSSNKKLPHSLFLIHYTISSSFGQFSSFLLTNVHKTPLQHFEDFFSCPFICCHFC